ncbi:unnamed protein product [Protopolystoma xenopodis]|uniref:Uncharacterized protein n=1 Tax=Protopolystoma xenopodis TaxID=117903 RepID=A0A3S5AQS6_9PLAT|nr:unnamed protein product [Protopolystoma xenopodis]
MIAQILDTTPTPDVKEAFGGPACMSSESAAEPSSCLRQTPTPFNEKLDNILPKAIKKEWKQVVTTDLSQTEESCEDRYSQAKAAPSAHTICPTVLDNCKGPFPSNYEESTNEHAQSDCLKTKKKIPTSSAEAHSLMAATSDTRSLLKLAASTSDHISNLLSTDVVAEVTVGQVTKPRSISDIGATTPHPSDWLQGIMALDKQEASTEGWLDFCQAVETPCRTSLLSQLSDHRHFPSREQKTTDTLGGFNADNERKSMFRGQGDEIPVGVGSMKGQDGEKNEQTENKIRKIKQCDGKKEEVELMEENKDDTGEWEEEEEEDEDEDGDEETEEEEEEEEGEDDDYDEDDDDDEEDAKEGQDQDEEWDGEEEIEEKEHNRGLKKNLTAISREVNETKECYTSYDLLISTSRPGELTRPGFLDLGHSPPAEISARSEPHSSAASMTLSSMWNGGSLLRSQQSPHSRHKHQLETHQHQHQHQHQRQHQPLHQHKHQHTSQLQAFQQVCMPVKESGSDLSTSIQETVSTTTLTISAAPTATSTIADSVPCPVEWPVEATRSSQDLTTYPYYYYVAVSSPSLPPTLVGSRFSQVDDENITIPSVISVATTIPAQNPIPTTALGTFINNDSGIIGPANMTITSLGSSMQAGPIISISNGPPVSLDALSRSASAEESSPNSSASLGRMATSITSDGRTSQRLHHLHYR